MDELPIHGRKYYYLSNAYYVEDQRRLYGGGTVTAIMPDSVGFSNSRWAFAPSDVFDTREAAEAAGRAHARSIAARIRAEAEVAAGVFDRLGEE